MRQDLYVLRSINSLINIHPNERSNVEFSVGEPASSGEREEIFVLSRIEEKAV